MALDLASELVAALRSPDGRAALADAVGGVVDDIVKKRLAEQAEQLQPLAAILGCSRKAASARLRSDARLRQLGVPQGANRPMLFRPSEVTAYLKSRGGK